MPIIQKLINHEELFKSLTFKPIILNDIPLKTKEDKEYLNNLTWETYEDSGMNDIPSCLCGKLTGAWSIGQVCTYCSGVVKSTLYTSIQSQIWIKSPDGIAPFFNPYIWILLNKDLVIRDKSDKNKQIPIFTYLAGQRITGINIDKPEFELLGRLTKKYGRGYNSLVNNFDSILAEIFKEPQFNPTKLENRQKRSLQLLIDQNRPNIYTRYLPLPNKILFLLEKTYVSRYAPPELGDYLNIIYSIAGIDINDISIAKKEKRIGHIMVSLGDMYDTQLKTLFMDSKTSVHRKQFLRSRCHYSFRAVVTSNTGIHQYDAIKVPWCIALAVFVLHITNKLVHKYNYLALDAVRFVYGHIRSYNPVIDNILKELINESPWDGIPVIMHRNPSMQPNSAQFVRIVEFKTDPRDQSVSVPILSVRQMNCD